MKYVNIIYKDLSFSSQIFLEKTESKSIGEKEYFWEIINEKLFLINKKKHEEKHFADWINCVLFLQSEELNVYSELYNKNEVFLEIKNGLIVSKKIKAELNIKLSNYFESFNKILYGRFPYRVLDFRLYLRDLIHDLIFNKQNEFKLTFKNIDERSPVFPLVDATRKYIRNRPSLSEFTIGKNFLFLYF
ncbi:MAG: hypothetical protein ABL940_11240, partial [Bacteroidia bacterium]